MNAFHMRLMLYALTVQPRTFLISIAISFIDIRVAQYFWILVFAAKIVARKVLPEIVNASE